MGGLVLVSALIAVYLVAYWYIHIDMLGDKTKGFLGLIEDSAENLHQQKQKQKQFTDKSKSHNNIAKSESDTESETDTESDLPLPSQETQSTNIRNYKLNSVSSSVAIGKKILRKVMPSISDKPKKTFLKK